MKPPKLKLDVQKFAKLERVEKLKKHLSDYEKKLRKAVEGIDLKSRSTREKGMKRLNKFTGQVRKTSGELEKHIRSFVNEEGKILNDGVKDLFSYLQKLAKEDADRASGASKKTSKKKAGGGGAKRKKTTSTATPAQHAESPPLEPPTL